MMCELPSAGVKTSNFLDRELKVQASSVLAADQTLHPKILKIISSHF
jgi:hypothetical protein